MALTAPSTAVAAFDKGRLAAGISASDTTITVGPIYKTVNGVRTKQGFDSTSGECIISQGDYQERISFEGSSVNATTKVTSLTTCTRGLPVTNTTANFTGGTGRAWAKGAYITVIDSASYNQSTPFKNVANTFTDHQTLDTTKELRFNSSATAVWKDGSDNLSFKDAANGTKTLTQLAAAGGTDEKVKVSSNDTTQGYLNGKLVAGAGITLTENSDGGNETLSVIATNSVATGHTGLSTVTTGGLLIGAGTSNMTIIGPGTSGQVPVSNGTTLAMGTASTYFKNYKSTTNLLASKDAVGNTVSETAFTTTYTIPANFFLATGDAMLVNLFGYTQSKGASAGTITLKLKFGSTVISTLMSSTMTDNTEQPWSSDLRIVCATQGASGKLYVDSYVRYEGSSTKDYYTHAYDSNNSSLGISFDTTASASLTVTCQFSVADVANYCVLDWMNINKISTTAF